MANIRTRLLVVLSALLVAIVVSWNVVYPSESDPKNMRYVLWKMGLYPLNPDVALDTMIGDRHRDRLIIGKTREDLRRKFGQLRPPQEASDYYRKTYEEGPYHGMDVSFLRASPWMVVFDRDKAAKLVLIKGS
jgi:hypothetical protein